MKIKQTLIALALVIGIGGFFISPTVSADCPAVSIIPCNEVCANGEAPEGDVCKDGSKPNAIWGILSLVINILTAGIGIIAVGGAVYGAILYTTAGGSVDQTKQAKTIIFNVIIGLVAYAMMYSFLNFIIPCGLL